MSEQMQEYEAYEREAKPSAVKGFLFILVLIAVVAAIGFFVLQNRSAEGPLVPTSRPVPIAVETVNATLEQAFQAEEKFTGIVTAKRTSQLGFPAGGRIASLRADLGSKVSAGQTLAVLDKIPDAVPESIYEAKAVHEEQ